MNNKICYGCGAALQSSDENKPGYVPGDINREQTLCQRCFKLKNYGNVLEINIGDVSYNNVFKELKDNLIIIIFDVFNFNLDVFTELDQYINNNPKLIIVNKIDLLPKSTNLDKVISWVEDNLEKASVKNVVGINLVSAQTGRGIDGVYDFISNNEDDIYIIGHANVGKSSFINSLLTSKELLKNNDITTSSIPGTTLDIIKIPIGDNYLVDTPGLVQEHDILRNLSYKSIKMITPKKELKPTSYQLNSGQTLFIGGLVRIDFVAGERSTFTLYVANSLKIHRTKLENSETIFNDHHGKMLSPPNEEEVLKLGAMVSKKIVLNSNEDLFIENVGWLTPNKRVELNVHTYPSISIKVRKSII